MKPVKSIFRLLAIVTAAELAVMYLLDNVLLLEPGILRNLSDAVMLAAICLPFMYYDTAKEAASRAKAEKEVNLLQTSTRAVLESRNFQTALELVIRKVCEATGWVLGEAWAPSPDGKNLRFVTAWSGRPDKVKNFIESSKKFTFAPGTGLPGRVWSTKKTCWVPDVTRDSNFPRAALAIDAGLKGAMSIPVLADGKFVIAMDFFVFETRLREDEHLISIVSTLADQLGAFIHKKQVEDAGKNLAEQLLQSQKMDALGQLAGGIAHDFNNLLTLIVGYNDFLLDGINSQDRLHSFAQEVKKAADGASALTKQLLSFSRKQVIFPREINLNAAVSDMGKMLKRLMGENIELNTVLHPELWPVKADSGQLEQVMLNLAINARDAMPKGGRLTIETANMDGAGNSPDCLPADNVMGPGNSVLLKIKDTGTGIDPAILPRIFEPFFTTKEPGKGTGLGLSTVYGIIKQNGGCISVDSLPGKGTTFSVYLPRTEGKPSAGSPAQGPEAPRGKGETILLVEDNPDILALFRRTLGENGYLVATAGNADEALTLCKNGGGKIHVMLTDLLLPGINGLELARKASSLYPGMKMLFMSGYAASQNGSEIVPPGAVLINKPFTRETLLTAVRLALDKK